MIIYGGTLSLVGNPEGWESTDGKCEHVMAAEQTIVVGYPLTSKTLETRDSYLQRWGEYPTAAATRAYDIIRFMLPDAIERAGTIETEAVIKALEEMDVETSLARNFVFTDSHGVMVGENPNNPDAVYMVVMVYQWQNGEQVPVCPRKIMEEAGVSYTFPDWPGPWDNIN